MRRKFCIVLYKASKLKDPAMGEASQGLFLSDGSGNANRGDNRQNQIQCQYTETPLTLDKKTISVQRGEVIWPLHMKRSMH
jgi:hypothetical protein